MVFGSLIFLFAPLFIAPRYYWSLILFPAIFIMLYFLSLWHYLHTLAPITDEVRDSFGELNSRLSEALDGIETVKGSAQEKDRSERCSTAMPAATATLPSRRGIWKPALCPMLLYGIAVAAGLLHALLLFRQG